MTATILRAAPALLLALAAAPAAAQAPQPNPDLLVGTEQLAARLGDAGTVVLHVGRSRETYDAGHVPGARFVPLSALVVERDGVPNELPPVPHLDSVFESLGVSDDTRVVLYGDLGGLSAARAFATLDYLGHGHAALLDGGLEAWKAEGRPLSTAGETAPRRGTLNPQPHPERVVSTAGVAWHRADPSVALLDARPPAEYTGAEAGGGVERPGHVPGAQNLFWRTALQEGEKPVLKDPEALRQMFRAAGVDEGDTVVTYCRTGVQASHLYFVSRYLGYPTRLYDASYLAWSGDASLPVER